MSDFLPHQARWRRLAVAGFVAIIGAVGVTACQVTSTVSPAANSSGAATSKPSPHHDSNPASAGCSSGRIEISYRMGEPQPDELCVHVGTEIVIILHGPPGYAWTPAHSSEPAIVSVTARPSTGGVGNATARALAPGHAEIRSMVSFTGDPFGPPTRLWRLNVRVVP